MKYALFALGSAVLTTGCVVLDYGDGTSSTGAGGDGGATNATSTSSSGGASTVTGTGGGPCTPTDETCNGVDDDCDGVVDEPPAALTGMYCGCTWDVYAGKLYAMCPATDGFATACPGGTSKVIVEDAGERQFVSDMLTAVHGTATQGLAFVSLAQVPTANDRVEGWAWAGGEGIALTWNAEQPDDYDPAEPARIENHDEDCGVLYGGQFGDAACGLTTDTYVACEETGATCPQGGPCLVAQGCTGTFDCSLPEGQRCVPSPRAEMCDGLDDNCDGGVDTSEGGVGSACGCTTFTAPFGRDYKLCAQSLNVSNAHCGPGFKLATPKTAEEHAFVQSLLPGSQTFNLGAFQALGSQLPDTGWTWFDRTPIPTFYWGNNQPNEGTLPESGKQNCLRTISDGWHDNECPQNYPYLCEAVP